MALELFIVWLKLAAAVTIQLTAAKQKWTLGLNAVARLQGVSSLAKLQKPRKVHIGQKNPKNRYHY